jgi:hypothetical protein
MTPANAVQSTFTLTPHGSDRHPHSPARSRTVPIAPGADSPARSRTVSVASASTFLCLNRTRPGPPASRARASATAVRPRPSRGTDRFRRHVTRRLLCRAKISSTSRLTASATSRARVPNDRDVLPERGSAVLRTGSNGCTGNASRGWCDDSSRAHASLRDGRQAAALSWHRPVPTACHSPSSLWLRDGREAATGS